jgi:radical SAM superfamily enzyme YgiQ (UPF0313 family)
MKNVLLVEPGYPTLYPPLGLMRISTWHKQAGDHVDFVKETPAPPKNLGYKPPELQKQYDIIYITSLFTYHYPEVITCFRKYHSLYPKAKIKLGGVLATLLPHMIKDEIEIEPYVGLFEEVEECTPDYALFPKMPYSLTFTSRGCFRGCKYCVVRLIEPRFFVREHWERDIKLDSKRIVFWDNNWLYSPNFYKDVEKLKQIDKPYDFNQGLDCRLFDKEKAKLVILLSFSTFLESDHIDFNYLSETKSAHVVHVK